MNTKHAREIRKGIRFAHDLHYAQNTLEDTVLRHYWLPWLHTWLHTASDLSRRAYLRTLPRLEYKDFLNQIQPVHPKDHP